MFFAGGVFRFWPVPEQNYTGKLTYQQFSADTEAAAAVDAPVSMLNALRDILVYRLADDFLEDNEGRIQRWRGEAMEAEKTILALNAQRIDTATVAMEYF